MKYKLCMIVILPNKFVLSPKAVEYNDDLVREGVDPSKTIQPYSESLKNILVIGPVYNEVNLILELADLESDEVPPFLLREFKFSISPPTFVKGLKFRDYRIVVGANLGRGQIYPSGQLSNVNPYISKRTGLVRSIKINYYDRTIVSSRPNSNYLDYDPLDQLLKTTRLSGVSSQINQFDTYVSDHVISVKPQKQVIWPGAVIPLPMPFFIEKGNEMTIDPNRGGFTQRYYGIEVQNPLRLVLIISLIFYTQFIQVLFVIKRIQYVRLVNEEL